MEHRFQGTSWRCKDGGHKRKATKWWKELQAFLLWGVLLVNAFCMMKLCNPNDRRTMREYKKSCLRWSRLHAPDMKLRYYQHRKFTPLVPSPEIPRAFRQTTNPYKTMIGSRHAAEYKLKAAAVCSNHSIRRMVPISMIDRYSENASANLLCKLCLSRGIRQTTTQACLSCGCELCVRPRETGQNRVWISCADAAHQQAKIDISNLKVKK